MALTKSEVITEEQAKQARVAAHVRTKATHADWDEFTMQGVQDHQGVGSAERSSSNCRTSLGCRAMARRSAAATGCH